MKTGLQLVAREIAGIMLLGGKELCGWNAAAVSVAQTGGDLAAHLLVWGFVRMLARAHRFMLLSRVLPATCGIMLLGVLATVSTVWIAGQLEEDSRQQHHGAYALGAMPFELCKSRPVTLLHGLAASDMLANDATRPESILHDVRSDLAKQLEGVQSA